MLSKWKLFCSVTIETYWEEAESLYQAKMQLAAKLNVPMSCIDVWED